MIERRSIREFPQRRALVHRNVIGLITLDLVLRFILAGMNRVSLELDSGCDHSRDPAADAAGFRIPAHMAALAESPLRHFYLVSRLSSDTSWPP